MSYYMMALEFWGEVGLGFAALPLVAGAVSIVTRAVVHALDPDCPMAHSVSGR